MATLYEGMICPQCGKAYPLRQLGTQPLTLANACYVLRCSSCGFQSWRQGLVTLPAEDYYRPEAIVLAEAAIQYIDPATCRKLVAEKVRYDRVTQRSNDPLL